MRKKVLPIFLCVLAVCLLVVFQFAAPANAAEEKVPFITDNTTTAEAVLHAWNSGNYSYVKLGADLVLTMTDGDIIVDLAGKNLTVSGSGKVEAFDTANDTFDHTVCGTLTVNDDVIYDGDYTAPSGIRYVALTDGNRSTLHRLDMKITSASLRMSTAGIYYKAVFACDRMMQEKIQSYGVAVSVKTMPSANFANADDVLYTVIGADEFVNGAIVNSGIINNILKTDSDRNVSSLNTKVFAKVYINIDGKNILGTSGAAASLQDLMKILDTQYSKCDDIVKGQLDDFHNTWKSSVNWSFANIGKAVALDFDKINANLNLDGNNQARCEVCNKVVTWTAVDGSARVVAANGGHYYLTNDVEFTNSDVSSFIAAPGTGGHKACFHLNGHNITATATKVIYGSSGVLNMMGNGTVSGYSNKTDEGAVFYSNNRNAENGINFYGGTYKRADNVKSTVPVIAFGGNGRAMNIYEGATIDAGTGVAVVFGGESGRQKEGFFNFYGCTINGTIKIGAFNTYMTNVKFVDTTINGTLTIPEGQNVVLSGKLAITDLVVPEGVTFSTKGIKDGSTITVNASGVFTEPTGSAASYVSCFKTANSKDKVCVRDGALCATKDYTSNLNFDEGTSDAYCPVCDKIVTWTAIDQKAADEASGESYAYQMADKGHYYLAEDVTYTGTATYSFLRAAGTQGQVSCFHLNGNNLTCTQRSVFYSGSGVLNVMGNGVVTGHSKSASYGAVVHTNNKNEYSSMNFYGGYYTSDKSVADAAVIKFGASAGRVYFSEEAVIDGSNSTYAIYVTQISDSASDGVLSLKDTTVIGDLYAAGAKNAAAYFNTIELDNVDLQGTLKAVGDNTITFTNKIKIDLLDAAPNSTATLVELKAGSDVTVKNVGVFAYPGGDSASADEAENYVAYFKTEWINDKIIYKDDSLVYKTNYEMRLQLNGESKAWCPVCMEYATWTALTLDETTGRKTIPAGGHYYLATDIVSDYAGTSSSPGLLSTSGSGDPSCLHLNGHNVVANNAIAIYGSQAGLNIMGSGSVKGYGHGTKPGAVMHSNNKNAVYGFRLYSGVYESLRTSKGVLSLGNCGLYAIYEDAVVGKVGNTGMAIDLGTAESNNASLYVYDAVINGGVNIPGASSTFNSVVVANNAEIKGAVTVAGTNDITFSGVTKIGTLKVAEGSFVNFDKLSAGSAIKVDAVGTFTEASENAGSWVNYFTASNSNDWVIVRDKALFQGEKIGLSGAEDEDITKLLAAYGDRVVKYGEMHNHTSAGLTADGRRTLAQWKKRMIELGMDFATIVDHKQVAHMYHKDWQTEPTEDSPVVFVGGSEPGTGISEMIAGTQGNMHYNMLTADPQKLVGLVKRMEEITGKDFYLYEKPYNTANWGANGANNKNKDFVWSDYNEPDGLLDRFAYPKWTRSEFHTMVELFYNEGSLIVEVHPDYPSYIKSSDPLDYCFAGNAGSATSAAMGFEITTGGYGRKPSDTYNERAYQLWLKMLDAGKKVYATYGDDGHRLPTAVAMTTAYAPENANDKYYMQLMHEGNFAPGWVGIRMMVGDTQMGGTAETFEGQRLVFSIGDMFQANEYSRLYLDKGLKQATMDWEPGYDPTCTYTARLYDDGGLLQESVVNPGDDTMDYFAIDADADAKFYRVEVWVEKQNADGSVAYRYRCGVGNPIWNAAAYATAE